MKTSSKLTLLFFIILIHKNALATTYIDLDFETTATGLSLIDNKDYPMWTISGIENNTGPGNLFDVVNTTAHTGTHSLRIDYTGQNGICNTCGGKRVQQKPGLNNVNYLIAKNGQDLTLEKQPMLDSHGNPVLNAKSLPIMVNLSHATPGKLVYDLSRGYSQWKILSVENGDATNDKLSLKLIKPGIGSFSSQKQIINGNDTLSIKRACGVDGIIGIVDGKHDTTRRSDCNKLVSWFGHIAPLIQPPLTSIFRRVYLKAEMIETPIGQKLNYARLLRGWKNSREIVPVAQFENGKTLQLKVDGLGPVGGLPVYRPGKGLPPNVTFERGVWYYLEQEFMAEDYTMTTTESNGSVTVTSYTGNGGGRYRLWFARAGEETNTPLIDLENIHLPPFIGGRGTHMSLWGNEGHHKHSRGIWYMDDLKIATQKIGPIPSNHTDIAAPNTPKSVNKQ